MDRRVATNYYCAIIRDQVDAQPLIGFTSGAVENGHSQICGPCPSSLRGGTNRQDTPREHASRRKKRTEGR